MTKICRGPDKWILAQSLSPSSPGFEDATVGFIPTPGVLFAIRPAPGGKKRVQETTRRATGNAGPPCATPRPVPASTNTAPMPPTASPLPGQRWVSESEAELGLGVIARVESGRAEVDFPAAGERRRYALASAPLRRVIFAPGDRISTRDGAESLVERVEEQAGLVIYHTAAGPVPEGALSDAISFSKPEDRLLAGQSDDGRTFDLRVEALRRLHEWSRSPVRGFSGGRVGLLKHQMFIAAEVASRLRPRVLLADEVGLGKTIEACLILHRLHLTGRAARILVLVPEPLIHQWFVELLRRFSLLFSIFDEARCESLAQHDEAANPFLDSQLVLAGLDLLAADPERAQQAVEAGWDLVVVDEAHHLEWTPEAASPAWHVVEALAKQTPGLLLLTATPEQLGGAGHFARLRLLDPERHGDLHDFLAGARHYRETAQVADRLLAAQPLSPQDWSLLASRSSRVAAAAAALRAGEETSRPTLISALVDESGPGRVMFRNTRAALGGFPKREAHLARLAPGENCREGWLAALLAELGQAKLLVITKTRETACRLAEWLAVETSAGCGLFHEGLTLLQRDRNAAFFASDEGARVLVCSEIGSEGRNFQFAHHLVLFDLPDDPDLLEQRIGRLDRIGQTETIRIHVPFESGTESEVLARWYHEGLAAFEHPLGGAAELRRELAAELDALRSQFDEAALASFLQKSRAARDRVVDALASGQDRLLELASCQPERAAPLIRSIRAQDESRELEAFAIRLFDHFGLHLEEMSRRTWLIGRGLLITDQFPALPDEGLTVTFDRTTALSREDYAFLTWDHPLIRGALDLLLGSPAGNASMAVWRAPGKDILFLELWVVVECVAPARLHAGRFLPPTPLRVAVDHTGRDRSPDEALLTAPLEADDFSPLLSQPAFRQKLLPTLLQKARDLAAAQVPALVASATAAMNRQLDAELARLASLAEMNPAVDPAELDALRHHQAELRTALETARLRPEALRLIWRKA